MILITAIETTRREGTSPTGIIARCLANQLLSRNERVRALVEPVHVRQWPNGVEVIEGSIRGAGMSESAFSGIDAVWLAGAEAATVGEVLSKAKRAGVRRVVTLSSHGCEYEIDYPPEAWFWLAIEKAVENSGMEWTHLRPSAVMGAMIEGSYPATGSDWIETIKAEGMVREPLLDRGYYPFIHEDDLAAVACALLLENQAYLCKIIEAVNMPVSTVERVRAIEKAIKKPIGTEESALEQGKARWRSRGWPEGAIDVTLYALDQYGTHLEELRQWTRDQDPSVERIIGRPLKTFEEWARTRLAAEF